MTGADILSIRDQLAGQRSMFIQHWRECDEVYMPFHRTGQDIVSVYSYDEIHDSTARQSALTFGTGLATLVCPRNEEFFEFESPLGLQSDEEVVKWHREATATAWAYLQSSNYWEQSGESLIELVVYGTCCLWIGDLDDRGEMNFLNQTIGTYYIGEDSFGRVNCVYRDLTLTAEQAAQQFGEKDLPEDVKKVLQLPTAKTEKFKFIQGVGKRSANDQPASDAPDSEKGEWYDMVIYEKTKKVVRNKSYREFPFAVCRYRRMGNFVWGYGPGAVVKGDAYQLSTMSDLSMVATERDALPPVKASSGLRGEVANGPGQITYVDANDPNSSELEEWSRPSDMRNVQWQMERKENMIKEAFFVPLFTLFSQRIMAGETPPTATEASYAQAEKLTQFSPVYGRVVSEMLDVLLERLYGVLLRAGAFPPMPQSMVRVSGGRRLIPKPSFLYKNKIVLAMQQQENRAFFQTTAQLAGMVQLFPDIMDNFDVDTAARDVGRNEGLPEKWIVSPENVAKRRDARAQAAAKQAQLNALQQGSEIVKNTSNAPPQALAAMTGAA